MKYVPQLDGLRAVAIIAVLLLHGSYGHIPGGFLGVDLFFALSGYLITRLLLAELAETGTVNLANFYRRRVARLYPALVACVLLTALLWPWETAGWKADWSWMETASAALFYYADFAMLHLGPLAHTWSLSIEEQFYIAWPTLCLLLWWWKGPRGALGGALAFALGAAVLRLVWLGEGVETTALYPNFFARIDTILIGAGAAIVAARVPTVPRALGLLLLAGFAGLVLTVRSDQRWLYEGGFTAIAVGATALVLGAPHVGVLAAAPLVWIGKRSYGLYLYHLPIFGALEIFRVHHSAANLVGVTCLRFGLTFVIAALSYRYLEAPVLARAHRQWRREHVQTQRIAVVPNQ